MKDIRDQLYFKKNFVDKVGIKCTLRFVDDDAYYYIGRGEDGPVVKVVLKGVYESDFGIIHFADVESLEAHTLECMSIQADLGIV